jgi:hypothetical protein
MSPEQAAGRPLDERSDLYSLGCVLYRLAVGTAFEGDGSLALLRAAAECRPASPPESCLALPPGLAQLLLRLLARAPAERPASAHALVEAFRALEAGGTGECPPGQGPAAGAASTGVSTVTFVPTICEPPPGRSSPWWGKRKAVGVALAAGAIAAAVLLALFPPWKPAEREGRGQSVPPVPLKGYLDLRVTEAANPRRQGLLLHQPLALPLRPNDLMEIEAVLNRPAYLYLVYLDSKGEATPLFPWKNYDWKQRPAEERRDRLFQKGPLDPGPSGIEALLLLARDEPLRDDEDLSGRLAGLPKQKGLPDRRARAWFENGELVRDEADRGAVRVGQGAAQDDPVRQTQALLRERLRPLFSYTRAVCFAFQGE